MGFASASGPCNACAYGGRSILNTQKFPYIRLLFLKLVNCLLRVDRTYLFVAVDVDLEFEVPVEIPIELNFAEPGSSNDHSMPLMPLEKQEIQLVTFEILFHPIHRFCIRSFLEAVK